MSTATIIMAVPLVLLVILVIMLLHSCTTDGCGNTNSLAEKALLLDNPSVCDERQLNINPKLSRYPFFGAIKDPPTTPPEDIFPQAVKSECLSIYTQNRTLPTENIKLCLSTGFNQNSCIKRVIEAYPKEEKCEELKGLKGLKDYDESDTIRAREDAYSSCFQVLALKTNKEEYCKKISHQHFINVCYAELANKRNDARVCNNIVPDGDLENPEFKLYVAGVERYETKEECIKWVRHEALFKQSS